MTRSLEVLWFCNESGPSHRKVRRASGSSFGSVNKVLQDGRRPASSSRGVAELEPCESRASALYDEGLSEGYATLRRLLQYSPQPRIVTHHPAASTPSDSDPQCRTADSES